MRPARALELKAELTRDGLVVNQDYTWLYTPPLWQSGGHEAVTPSSVWFSFEDDRLATFYQLRWSKHN